VLGASLLRAQGETAVYFPAYDDPADNGGIAERLDNERSTRLFAKATWGWLTLTSVMSDRVKRDPTGAFGVIFNTDSYSVDRYALTGLTFSRRLDETHELFARLGLSAYDYVGGGLYDVDAQRVPGHTRSRARWATGEMRYIWSGLRDHRLLLGVEYQNNFSQYLYSADLEPAPQVFLDRKFTSTRAAFFVTDEWHVLPSVHLTLGLRSDRRLDHGHSLTPRVAAVWTASPSWTFKLQHGSAFREPNVSETHYADGSQVDNAALSVERMRSTEVSALWRPREGLEVTASAYSFQLSESIALTTLPSGLEQYVNSGRLRSRGVELEATQEFASGVRVRGSVSLQRGIDLDTGRALNDSPHHLLKLMVTAPGPWVGSRLGGHLVHLGRRSTLAGATLPSSTRIDAQLTHTPPGQGWSVSVGLYNLTGERASDPAGPEHRQDTLPTLRRGWRVQVERAL
jgi:iron complex outermembrane receptor protein